MVRIRPSRVISIILAACTALVCAGCYSGQQHLEYRAAYMGTDFRIVLYAADEATGERAVTAAFQRIAELDGILSDYISGSELNRLSASSGKGHPVPVGEDLWQVLVHAMEISRASAGAFDVTIGPMVRLWRRAGKQVELPRRDRLDRALGACGYRHVVLDPRTRTALLLRPRMRLDLGGIAKGYAAAQALEVLETYGIKRALVDAGGDMALGSPPPGREGWRIALVSLAGDPDESRRYVDLSHVGMATSGDAFRSVEIDGIRYSHIVDPGTGLGLTTRSTVTVIAPDATVADALASALSVLPPRQGLALLEKYPGTQGRIIREEAGTLREYRSPAWRDDANPSPGSIMKPR